MLSTSSRQSSFVLAFLIGAWLVATIAIGRFTSTDEIAFKAAGREWAQSGRFAAPELTGFGGFDPPVETIWFAHLPVYTFAFGVFVKIFGFGAMQSVTYDALIHALLAVLTFALCRSMSPGASLHAVVAAALMLPLGTFGRADELAVCFALGAIIFVSARITTRRLIAAGVLFGLSMATSGVAALLLALHAAVVIGAQSSSLARCARALAIIAAAGTASAIACVAPILIAHPDALNQFRAHASHQFAPALSWGIQHSWIYGKHYVLPAIAGVLVAIHMAVITRGRPVVLQRFGVATLNVILILAFLPAKSYYLLFMMPILAASACATISELQRHRSLAAVAPFVIYFAGLATPLQQSVIHATLPSSQRLSPNVAMIRSVVPSGSVVLASEFWSEIAGDYEYRSLVHGEPDFARVDYVILTGNGSGAPGRPQTLTPRQQSAIASGFEVVHENLPRAVPRRFGIRLSHSGWGYGTIILRRRDH